MRKPLVLFRPWWRHPVFPWGWYSIAQDFVQNNHPLPEEFWRGQELHTDGVKAPGDGGSAIYKFDSTCFVDDPNSKTIIRPDHLPASGRWVREK